MKKIIIFLFLTLFWIFVLFPKDLLWSGFVDTVDKKGIQVKAKTIDMQLWLLYDKIEIKDMIVSDMLKVKSVSAKYTILNPLHITFFGTMEFGDFTGDISLPKRVGYILLKKPKHLGMLRRYFKKTKEGYRYEFDF